MDQLLSGTNFSLMEGEEIKCGFFIEMLGIQTMSSDIVRSHGYVYRSCD